MTSQHYEIIGLQNGRCVGPTCTLLRWQGFDTWREAAVYVWLIRGGGKTVLVDAGLGNMEQVAAVNAAAGVKAGDRGAFETAPEQDLPALLASAGTGPEDIDYLILSHLHYDHCVGVPLFRRARVVVSKRGWLHAMAPPHPDLARHPDYPRDILAYLAGEAWDRLVLVEDEWSPLPGIKVFWVGGHTPCSQAVSVQTPSGTVVLAGDLIPLYENLERRIPTGNYVDLAQVYAGTARVLAAGDTVVPGHDPEILQRYPGGRIA